MKLLKRFCILTGVLIISSLFFEVFAHNYSQFQDRLYCKVSEKSVRVYLYHEKETLKCQYFIFALNAYLKNEYDALLQIITNRNRGDDPAYWDGLFYKKKGQFLDLFSQRKIIQLAMQEFEKEFLSKSKLFLQESLLEKQSALQRAILATQEQLTEDSNDVYLLNTLDGFKYKQSVIDSLLLSKTMDDFMKEFMLYLNLFPLPKTGK